MQKNKSYSLIKSCRLCQSINLTDFIDFGEVALGNNLLESSKLSMMAEKYPLKINRCKNCNHFQLSSSVKPDKLYSTNYTYLSGIGKSFRDHLKQYYKWAETCCNLSSNSLILDVGSNDGSCLKVFLQNGHRVVGVDPASLPAEIANKNAIPTYNAYFSKETAEEILTSYGQPDFITSQNVLAHVEDIRGIFSNIYNLLKQNGYFAFEIGYFREVLRTGCFDTTYHEHLDYHHSLPISRFLNNIGFDIIDFSVNSIQGGSLRVLTKKTGNKSISKEAKAFMNEELNTELYDNKFLEKWANQVSQKMSKFGNLIKDYSSSGKTIAGYGCPTKSTLLLKMANLNKNQIPYILEDNNLKVGRYLPNTAIPILKTENILEYKPDIIIILAWNFSEDIISRLRSVVTWPMTCIVPLPNLYEVKL